MSATIIDKNAGGSTHMRARQRNIIELQLEPGQVLERVPGGFIVAAGRNSTGKFCVELKPGQKLHKITGGYIIQPAGAPDLSAKGVAGKIGRSINWIHILTRRGPMHALGGLQGYLINVDGNGWVPKIGRGTNGAEVMYYREDVEEWASEYAPPSDGQEEDLTRYLNREVAPAVYNLFKSLGQPEQLEKGYVTRTRVMQQAKLLTRYKCYKQLANEAANITELARLLQETPEYSPDELEELFGISKPISDRDYTDLMAVAAQEGWGNSPKRVANTSTYRRKPRQLLRASDSA